MSPKKKPTPPKKTYKQQSQQPQQLTTQQRKDIESEYKKLAKRINQRMVRAEQRGLTHSGAYKNIANLISNSTSSTSRFQEYVSSKMTDTQLLDNLKLVRAAEKVEDITGKSATKQINTLKERFLKGGFDLEMGVIDEILQTMQGNAYGELHRHLDSKQIVDIMASKGFNQKDIEILVSDYMSVNGTSQINRRYFAEYMRGIRDKHNNII